MQDSRRTSETGSCAFVHQHTAEACSVVLSGIYQGEERDFNSKAIHGASQEFHGWEFLGKRLLCIHSRAGRRDGASIHPKSGKGRWAIWPTQALRVRWAPSGASRSCPFEGLTEINPRLCRGSLNLGFFNFTCDHQCNIEFRLGNIDTQNAMI